LTDEGLRHARCGAVLAFIRRRQVRELDFHCRVCHEHIALTEYALTRIPLGAPRGVGRDGGPEMIPPTFGAPRGARGAPLSHRN
jgi:hypothetical protein